jgi:hypothetical protein
MLWAATTQGSLPPITWICLMSVAAADEAVMPAAPDGSAA